MKTDCQVRILGCDIGGANLKFATVDGYASSTAFPLWKHPEHLADALSEEFARIEKVNCLAITMTGELVDAYESQADGVTRILNSVVQARNRSQPGTDIRVYSFDGFIDCAEAINNPSLVAAANWHAIASCLADQAGFDIGLAIDCGSTTTDVTPMIHGVQPLSDLERLANQSLVYQGVRRTPLMGLAESINLDGRSILLANEWFASTEDVYLLTGDLDRQSSYSTADGRDHGEVNCMRRIAKMLCSDLDQLSQQQVYQLATEFKTIQKKHLAHAIRVQLAQVAPWLSRKPVPDTVPVAISGEGEFLIRDALNDSSLTEWDFHVISATDYYSKTQSECLGALAVAKLFEKTLLTRESS